jgi:hypothetical protein
MGDRKIAMLHVKKQFECKYNKLKTIYSNSKSGIRFMYIYWTN